MQTEYVSLSFTFSPPEVPVIYREEHNAPVTGKTFSLYPLFNLMLTSYDRMGIKFALLKTINFF